MGTEVGVLEGFLLEILVDNCDGKRGVMFSLYMFCSYWLKPINLAIFDRAIALD